MTSEPGLRERKRQQTRDQLADAAARLFAERGYDAVSILDVARAANVSEQTVYNYFPTKPELVLDRADEIRDRYRRVVTEHGAADTPADALRPLVHEDIDRYRDEDPTLARGEFPTQCLQSGMLRRYALEMRDLQVATVADVIRDLYPALNALAARAHAAALISIIQAITDRIGAAILQNADPAAETPAMHRDADLALDDAADNFRATVARLTNGGNTQ